MRLKSLVARLFQLKFRAAVVLFSLVLLKVGAVVYIACNDSFNAYRPLDYLQETLAASLSRTQRHLSLLYDCGLADDCECDPDSSAESAGDTPPVVVEDKILVIPALESIDMSWVESELPDWQRAIYTVNPSNTTLLSVDTLVTPINKGNEAMPYLTYIIDNYNQSRIPPIVAFLHSHRQGFFEAWHVDTPLHDNVVAMRLLNLDYVREKGYVNLRCNWTPGCMPRGRGKGNTHITGEVWDEVMGGTSTPFFNPGPAGRAAAQNTSQRLPEAAGNGVDDRIMTISSGCCAQFAVSRERIYERPLEDYVRLRKWLLETKLDNAESGRVFEYMWHIIFGMEATHCPDQKSCYCNVYGRC